VTGICDGQGLEVARGQLGRGVRGAGRRLGRGGETARSRRAWRGADNSGGPGGGFILALRAGALESRYLYLWG